MSLSWSVSWLVRLSVGKIAKKTLWIDFHEFLGECPWVKNSRLDFVGNLI